MLQPTLMVGKALPDAPPDSAQVAELTDSIFKRMNAAGTAGPPHPPTIPPEQRIPDSEFDAMLDSLGTIVDNARMAKKAGRLDAQEMFDISSLIRDFGAMVPTLEDASFDEVEGYDEEDDEEDPLEDHPVGGGGSAFDGPAEPGHDVVRKDVADDKNEHDE
jgi:hypothetical protein